MNITSTVNISNRPISIRAEQSHFIAVGRVTQLDVAPISLPIVGPTFPILLNTIVIEFIGSMPYKRIMNTDMRHINK